MMVTKTEAVTKTKFRVYIDGKFAFVLYKSELSRYHVAAGEELEVQTYKMLREKVVLKRAKLRSLYLLNAMGRTESQLRQKLRGDGYPEDIINEAVDYVSSYGYLNDVEYARNFIDIRKEKKSRKELYAQLSGKGIAQEVLDKVFEECYEDGDSRKAIREILRKKKYDPACAEWQETRKILGYLARKGFAFEDIRQVIQLSEWDA